MYLTWQLKKRRSEEEMKENNYDRYLYSYYMKIMKILVSVFKDLANMLSSLKRSFMEKL